MQTTLTQRFDTQRKRYAKIEENKTECLINELKTGEKSEMIPDFDRKQALSNLHSKYLLNEV